MISVENITLEFPGKPLLHGQFFKAEAGEIVGLLGRNGCGKSTLMELMFGLRAGSTHVRGTVFFRGVRTENLCETANAAFFLYQDRWIPKGWTGRRLAAQFLPDPDQQKRLFHHPFFQEFGSRPFEDLSGGEGRILELLTALAADRSIYFLDEPFSELSPLRAALVRDEIRRHSAGKVFFVTGHSFPEMAEVCTRLVAFAGGRLHPVSTTEDLIRLGYLPKP